MDENKNVESLGEKIPQEVIENEEKQYYPKIVEKPFIPKKKPFWKKLLRVLLFIPTFGRYGRSKIDEIMVNPDLKQPILQLIKDDGYTDWLEGVKKGLFIINMKDNKQKAILLSPNKLTTLNVEPYPKMWIAYENEMTPYPIDIYHDGEEALSIIRKIETNRDLLKDEAKLISAKMMFWIAIIGISLVGIYFGIKNGWFEGLVDMFK
jgi:hypothetical protein